QAEWMKLAVEERIPIGPAPRDFHEMRRDPHVSHRGIMLEAEHPVAGRFTCTGEGAIVAGQPFGPRPAPAYDEHGAEIRRELDERARSTTKSDGRQVLRG